MLDQDTWDVPGCCRTAWDRSDVLDQGQKGPDDPGYMGLDGTSWDVPGQLRRGTGLDEISRDVPGLLGMCGLRTYGISQDFLVFICRTCWAFRSSPSVQLKEMGHVGHSMAILGHLWLSHMDIPQFS